MNNQYLWRVRFEAGGLVTVLFCPQETLWNKSFRDFLKHLETLNPDSIKSEC